MFKKLLIFTICILGVFAFNLPTCAIEEKVEHIQGLTEAKTDLVKINADEITLLKNNRLKVAFSDNFNSKYYNDGDLVQFVFMRNLATEEGSLIIPVGTTLLAKIDHIEKPKWFSRNARVGLELDKLIFDDGTTVPLNAELVTKNGYLQKGAGDTAKKIGAQTLAIGATGAGLGAAIGVAGGNVISGLIIGGSIGGGVGLFTGIVSPGVYYKVKQGAVVHFELTESLVIPRPCSCL
ncbi:hypothetical protein tpqmel_0756 [Candidatus Gastranaerophilus sp. (ex Termes propinquus)]|nr:hypothetical protein tpqmel_0756 [Candidatus Gastranaerophilus sp. (ex Termes propinquus)]